MKCDAILLIGNTAPAVSLASQPGPQVVRNPLAARNLEALVAEIQEDQKTNIGARLKPGSTGAFASKSSLPLHFSSTA
jgi:hypothetical protein